MRDVNEGADILMVKPTLPYLDILSSAQQLAPDHPLACYQVSGEYAMIVAGAEKGIYGLKEMAMETMDSFLRAGGSFLSPSLPYCCSASADHPLSLADCDRRCDRHSDVLHAPAA